MMWEFFVCSNMVLVLLISTGIVLIGLRGAKGTFCPTCSTSLVKWPNLSVVVPVTGADSTLVPGVKSLLSLEYPDYQVVFAMRNSKDPAAPVIRDLIRGHAKAGYVFAGDAQTCSQKNHNLLAGIRKTNEATEILVFCDAGHVAPSHWLKALVEPIARGDAMVTTAYHRIIPENLGLPTLGKSFTVLMVSLLQVIGPLTQPWGGAMAIQRDLFEKLDVEELWGRHVVDDVCLARRLARDRIRTVAVPEANLETPLVRETMINWHRWLVRQLQYLRLCFPFTWAGAGFVMYLISWLVLLSLGRCLQGVLGWIPSAQILPAVLFLLLLTGLGILLKAIYQRPIPLAMWLLAGYAFIFVASCSHMRSSMGRIIRWRDFSYQIARNGKVLRIMEDIPRESTHRISCDHKQ
jgi:ceramide glucosyltransferase